MRITSIIYQGAINFIKFFPAGLRNNLFHLIKFLKIPNGKFRNDLKFHGKFKLNFNEVTFYMNSSGGGQENTIFWRGLKGSDEPETIAVIYKLRSLIDTFIDIGANTGIYSLFVKAIQPTSKVIAFEPSKTILHELEKNIAINKVSITLEKVALSESTGELTFYDTTAPNQTSASLSARMHQVNRSLDGKLFPYQVSVDTLDNYLTTNKIKKVDLIKIDVELHEPEVFRGMKNTLQNLQPNIIFECLFQDIADQLQVVLDQNDYVYYHLEGGANFKLRKVDMLTGRLNKDWNYFACHKSNAEAIEKLCL
jgi:FkbM family methyltransferase